MELFGIMFSVPVSFVATSIYAVIIKRITTKRTYLIVPLFWISGVILTLIILEFVGVLTVGAIRLREIIGVQYYPLHISVFFLFWPSLANIMGMQRRIGFLSKWYMIGIACAFLGLCVTLLQYGVSEALYGIDGTGGPYGKP
jgi:hypothetical protein